MYINFAAQIMKWFSIVYDWYMEREAGEKWIEEVDSLCIEGGRSVTPIIKMFGDEKIEGNDFSRKIAEF
jgi:hypothetical protein